MPSPPKDPLSRPSLLQPAGSRIGRGVAIAAALIFGIVLVTSACGDPEAPAPDADPAAEDVQQNNIVDVAIAAGQFSDLVRAVQAAGLAETLQEEGPFTVFAPTDGAFAGLPDGALDELMEDPDALAEILLHHVVPGIYTEAEIRELSSLETAQGTTLEISDTRQGVLIDGANILTANVRASNGIIHVITMVLTP